NVTSAPSLVRISGNASHSLPVARTSPGRTFSGTRRGSATAAAQARVPSSTSKRSEALIEILRSRSAGKALRAQHIRYGRQLKQLSGATNPPRGIGGALRSVSVEERRDRHETERRYERGVVDLTDGSGATVSGTMYDRLESDQVLRRAKRVLDIRVRTAAGIDVQNAYPAAWRIRCPVLLDQLRIEKEHGGIRVAAA